MRDGIEQPAWESHRPKLDYPFDHTPKIGEAIEVGPGVMWMRMEGGQPALRRISSQRH